MQSIFGSIKIAPPLCYNYKLSAEFEVDCTILAFWQKVQTRSQKEKAPPYDIQQRSKQEKDEVFQIGMKKACFNLVQADQPLMAKVSSFYQLRGRVGESLDSSWESLVDRAERLWDTI